MIHPNAHLVRQAGRRAQQIVRDVDRFKAPMTSELGLVALARETVRQAGDDHLNAFAGNLTFNGILAVFPFFLFLLSLLAVFHLTQLVHAMLTYARSAFPGPAYHLLRDQVVPLTQSHEIAAFTFGAALSILFALWTLSWAFSAIMEAMNVMYDVKETRPLWLTYTVSVVMSVAAVALLVSALVLVAFGSQIGDTLTNRLGLGATFSTPWAIAQWPILIFFVLLAFALIYWAAPNVRQSFRLITPGSLIGVAIWLVFSIIFSQYIDRFGSYNALYGAFAGMVVLLLYMYYSSYILLLGAELNVVIQRHSPERENERISMPGDGRPSATRQAKTRDKSQLGG